MIRVTVVMDDCRVAEFERKTWKAAAEAVIENAANDLYTPHRWFKIYATNPDRRGVPEEWKLSLLKQHVASGEIPDHD
jgi:hypothetical protein